MNKYHQEILDQIIKTSGNNFVNECNHGINLGKYMDTTKPIYNLSNPQIRALLRMWLKQHSSISFDQLVGLLNSLYNGKSHTERSLGGKILESLPKLRKQISPHYLKQWLTGAEGWGEVDSLCQSSFTAQEILENWEEWEKLFNELVTDPDVHKRRASLVLLTKSVRESDDPKLSGMAFANIDKLKGEKDILITKAVSWLLRSLIEKHPQEVDKYLKDNKDTLPKIALRETSRKLLTGKK